MARKPTKAPKPLTVKELPPRVWANRDGSQGIAFPLRYRDPNDSQGGYIRVQYPTKAERTRARIKIEGQLTQNTYSRTAETMTLAEFAWQHLADKKERGISLGRLIGIETKFRLHILGGDRDTPRGRYSYLGDKILTKLMPADISAWVREIYGKAPPDDLISIGPKGNKGEQHPRGRRLIEDVGIELQSLLERACEKRLIFYNPAKGVDFTYATAKRENDFVYAGVDFMTPDEAEAILRYVKLNLADVQGGIWYPVLATYLYGGLRSGELRALRVSELDFEGRRINVRHAISAATTKRGPPKSKAAIRDVPMVSPLLEILRDEWLPGAPRAGGRNWRIEQVLKAQPDLTVVSDYAIAAALGSPGDENIRSASWRARKRLGLPSFRNGNRTPQSVVIPLGLPEKGAGNLDLVFPNSAGHVLGTDRIKFMLRDVQRALGMISRDADGNPVLSKDGLPHAKYSPHSCRHFYVSYLAHYGFSLEQVGRWAGHESEVMTKHYRHFFEDPKRRREDDEKLQAAFLALDAKVSRNDTKVVEFSHKAQTGTPKG
jgi:integrase